MPIIGPTPGASYIEGRRARQQEDYGNIRNALAQLDLENAPREMQNRNRLLDLQTQGAEQSLGAEKAKYAYTTLKQAIDSGNPKSFILQQVPDLARQLQSRGIDLQSMDDQAVAQLTDQLARKYAGEAGIAPTPAPVQMETISGPGGSLLQRNPQTGEMKQVVGREPRELRPQKAPSKYRALTQKEVASAGLPAGSSAQIDESTGKIDVLSLPDQTGTLSQKDATTSKMKLNTVKLARQQLNSIRQRFQALKGSASAGPFGQGRLPTEKGRAFDRAVDQMRSTLTALTRVPGVGAMSDYETKLDQAKFPTRMEYESVTAQQIADLDNMLNAIEAGYSDLLSGSVQSTQPQQSQQPQQLGEPVRVNTPQEAIALPPGTVFLTPDGRRKVR